MNAIRRIQVTLSLLLLIIVIPDGPSLAEPSSNQYTAVFICSSIWPDVAPQVEIMAVSPVGSETYPGANDIWTAIMQCYQGETDPAVSPAEQVGDLWRWGASNSQTLVDRRDGAILFAGTSVWMGLGHVVHPVASSHLWTEVVGDPAAEPAVVNTMVNDHWDGVSPDVQTLTDVALTVIRGLDVMHSFAANGDYIATGWVYTPTVGATDPNVARLILVVEGTVGAPWNGESVENQMMSWSELKSSYGDQQW